MEWNDELVKEFQIFYNKIPYAITGIDPIKTGIEMFKKYKVNEKTAKDLLGFHFKNGFMPPREEPKKGYEILSFCNGTFVLHKNPYGTFGGFDAEERVLLSSSIHKIHSVKRLLDGEVFTVGDKLDLGVIKSVKMNTPYDNSLFFIVNNGSMEYTQFLEFARKAPKYSFKTEDGVTITDEDQTLFVVKDQWGIRIDTIKAMVERGHDRQLNSEWKYFSTKEAAKEYILMNKPVHSVNDVLNLLKKNESPWDLKELLINASKSKLTAH